MILVQILYLWHRLAFTTPMNDRTTFALNVIETSQKVPAGKGLAC